MRLVFSSDEKSGLKEQGDAIAPFRARAVQDPPGLDPLTPVGSIGPGSLEPGAILGEDTFSIEGPHILDLTLPTADAIIYVHFRYPVGMVPTGDSRVEIHGARIELLL